MIKLKQTSAVKKQSSKELDFESKFKQLHKAAVWTNKDWLTYDYSQLSLLLASAIFDFKDCKIFPYLFPQEGDCGGFHPQKNIDATISAMNFFNSGSLNQAIIGIMDESTLIQECRIDPRQGVYMITLHYVQSNNNAINKIASAKRFLKPFNVEE